MAYECLSTTVGAAVCRAIKIEWAKESLGSWRSSGDSSQVCSPAVYCGLLLTHLSTCMNKQCGSSVSILGIRQHNTGLHQSQCSPEESTDNSAGADTAWSAMPQA